jgi:UDP-N-acetylglucosamine 2-epimerase (non-hydrolysing)
VVVVSKRIALIIGTRPEAIKLGPVYQELARRAGQFEPLVIATAQHRQMLDQMLPIFGMAPEVDLDLMKEGQTLAEVTCRALGGLQGALQEIRPDLALVQGDTTTVLAGALAAFYEKIPVGHVEAGLRTGDKYSPFPEEINRRLTTPLADLHFAATAGARDHLLREGVAPESIFVTGNPVIDALRQVASHAPPLETTAAGSHLTPDQRLLLVTAHRRENLGQPLRNICRALRVIVEEFGDVHVLYAVHPNPQVRETAGQELAEAERVTLIKPPNYLEFVALMQRAYLILTDSGGVQEEAPALGVPALVMRDTSERPEGLACGSAELVGTSTERIVHAARRLLTEEAEYQRRRLAPCPYGDGKAAQRIVDALGFHFGSQPQRPANWEVTG